MKPKNLLFCIFLCLSLKIKAQVTDDVYNSNSSSNVKDTLTNSVSKIGHYISLGLGIGNAASLDLIGYTISYSLAIKSHLITISKLSCGLSDNDFSFKGYSYSNDYFALLFGEAFRKKNLLLSLSAGIGFSDLTYIKPVQNVQEKIYWENGVSIPIELRLFFLPVDGIGVGLNINRNFTSNYSPTLFSFSIIFGEWYK